MCDLTASRDAIKKRIEATEVPLYICTYACICICIYIYIYMYVCVCK